MAAHEHDGHDHSAVADTQGRAFAIGVGVQATFVLAEVAVGLFAGSLAVLADAGHNASDVLALALAWGAAHLSKHKPSMGRTYGLQSASILAALANALTLVFVNGAVAWEAVARLRDPAPVTIQIDPQGSDCVGCGNEDDEPGHVHLDHE